MLDERMREAGIIKGAQSYIPAGSITATELDAETITVSDIADNAVTAAKIAAAVAGDGIAGGAGTALSVDVDNSTLAIVGNQVAVKSAGITKTQLAAAAKKREITVALPAFVANSTVRYGVMAVPTGKSVTITKADIACYQKPADADGTCTIRLVNYDTSATADDEIIAAFDCEGIVAIKTGEALTVISAGSVNTLEANDYLYVELVNNSAGIDTPWLNAVLTIEYQEV
jgi:hypothetical protein